MGLVLQGDGAWAPKSGERSTAAVAHGTHQNQYTKRKALLNGAKLAADSNEAEEEADDSKDEEEQADNCADTGFAAKPSSRRTAGLSSKGTAAVKEQDKPALSQAGTKRSAGASGAALEPKESGVSSKQQAPVGAPDAQPQRATRAGRKASSGLANGLTKEQPASKRRQHSALGRVVQNAEHSSSEMDPLDTSEPQSKPDKRNDAVTEPVSPQQLAERTSEHDAHSVPEPNVSKESASAILAGHKFASNSDKDEPVQENVPDTAEDHSTRHDPAHVAAQVTSGVDQPSSKPILATSKGGKSLSDSKAAAAQQHNVSDTTPSNVQKHNVRRGQKGALEKGPNATAAAGDAKLQPGLEEALQCEENLAEDTSASPGELVL